MMKILVIAFDSLEPSLVGKWDLHSLKQKQHGRVEIDVEPLATPTVWASFLTGLEPKQHGIHHFSMSRFDHFKTLYLQLKLDKIFEKSIKTNIRLQRVLNLFSVSLTTPTLKNTVHETIFEHVRKFLTVDVPTWDTVKAYEAFRRQLVTGLGSPDLEAELERQLWAYYFEKVKNTLELLKEDSDLFMVHFLTPDIIQHLCWREWHLGLMPRLFKAYQTFDRTARQLQQKHDGVTLIVSDHGQRGGVHTPHGFYSTNIRFNCESLKITSFKCLIKQWLQT